MYRTKFYEQLRKQTTKFIDEYSNLTFDETSSSDSKTFIDNTNNISSEQLAFMNKIGFPIELKMIFNIIGSSDKLVISNEFSFRSLDEIIAHSDDYENIIDLGDLYSGMGHYYVLTFDKKTKQFFYRMDGGGNGLEREVRYKFYKTVVPSNFYKIKKSQFRFSLQFMEMKNDENIIDAFDFC